MSTSFAMWLWYHTANWHWGRKACCSKASSVGGSALQKLESFQDVTTFLDTARRFVLLMHGKNSKTLSSLNELRFLLATNTDKPATAQPLRGCLRTARIAGSIPICSVVSESHRKTCGHGSSWSSFACECQIRTLPNNVQERISTSRG